MSFIEILKAVLFGIVEGITEWLPVSSTGHMILLDELVKMNVSEEFWSMFLVVIQLGAILAVVVLYWNRLFPFNIGKKPVIRTDIFQMWFKIIAACIPAGIVGIFFDDKIDKLFYNYQTVATMLIIFGVLFIVIENVNHGKRAKILGRICMDQFMVDLTGIPEAKEGDSVTLVGRDGNQEITMEELAEISGGFHYEIPCLIGKRVPRRYVKNGKEVGGMMCRDEEYEGF